MSEDRREETTQAGPDGFACSRCGRGSRMAERPFKGKLGERVWAHVCGDCWHAWIRMGTRVINELGLVLGSPEGQAAYDTHLKEFLNLPGQP
ncbi:MAG: Fe(2+)-trafficking protein [Phycisphaerae bacterium]|nr:Fe(2+)-trafficking protein [Phycisphaerae bacterium]